MPGAARADMRSMRILLLATILLLLALPAAAHAATPPQHAARVTAGCLRDHGWATNVHGRTVTARSPRVRPAGSVPRRPQFRVTFSDPPFPPIEVRWALNVRENHTAARCLLDDTIARGRRLRAVIGG